MAYHKNQITKGILGELSKIQEELDEAVDAENQGAKILVLCELADLIGAVDAYLSRHLGTFTLRDLQNMAELTKSAFEDGTR